MTDEERTEATEEASEEEEAATASEAEGEEKETAHHPRPDPIRDY